MSHQKGQVRFNDGSIKYFEYNCTSDICISKIYNTYDEMIDNWRKWKPQECTCEHIEEPVEIYTDYGGGSYWNGTVCRKCMMILQGKYPCELEDVDGNHIRYTDGTPKWVKNLDDYYD